MTLTIAIPSYNKEKYIERCIKSVLVDKAYIDEIILIDNCSTDRTFELAKKFEPEIKCVKNEHNLGMSGNFNRCIDLCKTDWLMIFHADDELIPGSIRHYLDFFKKYPSVGIAHANFFYIKNGNLDSKIYAKTDDKEIRKAGSDAMNWPKGYACSTVMVRKSAYDNLGYYIEESLSSDVEMFVRISNKYDKGHLDVPTAIVHLNSDSTGRNSLVNREPEEVEADWKSLGDKILTYHSEEARESARKEGINGMINGLIIVATTNIKAGQYKKALKAIRIIIFKYHGFFKLFKSFFEFLRHRVKTRLTGKYE